MPKKYIEFDPNKGYPAGKSIFYECSICENVLPSLPVNAAECECGNIVIDSDAGRVSIKNEGKFKIFKK